ncbi:helix-turn-helix transcriptional regulator [Virgibacillus sp. YIM 98842]|uniref:helix-turn-helix domain-containing protein n=1 Tax=Virgibacillus sp. YIM 98842 TaxID=2663533 RepID=UPI0013DD0E27|nr:helix-turn-helix transcriptional regulator [Virgibacillus sp. YIM 98842]
MSLEQLSYNIKFFRDQLGLTQQELADKLNISRSNVAKWESDKALPDAASLINLSKLFDVSVDHLTGNHAFREDLLKEFKRIYSSESLSFEEEAVDLMAYIMTHPDFKEDIYRLKNLPMKKQLSIHKLFRNMLDQYEQL